MWVVIGDSYAGSGRGKGDKNKKSKDLIGIIWQLAFVLREYGWYLRQDIIWHKPNPIATAVLKHTNMFLCSQNRQNITLTDWQF